MVLLGLMFHSYIHIKVWLGADYLTRGQTLGGGRGAVERVRGGHRRRRLRTTHTLTCNTNT